MRRSATLLLLLVLAPGVRAQTPDPVEPARYLPLAPGNTWVYEHWVETCVFISSCQTTLTGYESWRVVGDSAVGGQTYAVLAVQGYSASGAAGAVSDHLVRFDAVEARGVVRTPDGTEAPWPSQGMACRLDAPYGPDASCTNGPAWATSPYTLTVTRNGATEEVPVKDFRWAISWTGFAADVGYIGGGTAEFGGVWTTLAFARVGSLSYGNAVVAGEAAPLPTTLGLTVAPNPVRGTASLRLSLAAPGRVEVEAYDVTGRRVYAEGVDAGAAGTHLLRVDAAAWAPGLYVVRATTDSGQTATTRLVRAE